MIQSYGNGLQEGCEAYMQQNSTLQEAEFHKAYQELIEAVNITACDDPDTEIKMTLIEIINEALHMTLQVELEETGLNPDKYDF